MCVQHTATADLVSSEHTDLVMEFDQDSSGTFFVANGYSANHVPTRVRTEKTPTKA